MSKSFDKQYNGYVTLVLQLIIIPNTNALCYHKQVIYQFQAQTYYLTLKLKMINDILL